ncbi:MAG: hypothetical protein CMH83_21210 [Nocardioides sp.]|nr:hypothetical protein [Nocardioides sp.]
MHRARRTVLTTCLTTLMLGAAACSGDDAASGSVELTATNLLPPNDAQSEMIQWFMDELEARTDGEVRTEVVHAGALLPGADTLPGLQQGRADAGNVVHAYFPAELPLHNVNVVPVEGDQSARLRAFQDTSDGVEAWRDELAAYDLMLVGFLPNTSSTVTFNSDVASLAEVDGTKIRVPSQTVASVWEEFGVEPIFMPSEEVYEAVERGIVDGTLYPMGTQISTGITDVAKVMAPDVGQNGAGTFAFTVSAYDDLSDDAKEVFEDLQGEWYDKADELLTKYETEACEEFLASGGTVVLWSDAEQAQLAEARPVATDVWRQSAIDAGADSGAVDEVWDTFSTAVDAHAGQSEYRDGLATCAESQE